MTSPDFDKVAGFDWDVGNFMKSERHGVSPGESEQVFVNEPLVVLEDAAHSRNEARWNALGRTNEGRLLHVTFTLRAEGTRVRVISARPMHRRERAVYERASEADS